MGLNKRTVHLATKKEIFDRSRNWQSARSTIRKDAERQAKRHDIARVCYVCGYSKHVEVSHIKSVSSFNDDATIEEINSPNNLIMLCPNHHWEFDNDLLLIKRDSEVV